MANIVGTSGDDLILSPTPGVVIDATSDANWVPGVDSDSRAGEPLPLLAFSPDGSKIAFTVGGTGLVPGVDTGPYSTQVFVKDLSTGAITLVSSNASGAPISLTDGASTPVFTADGTGVFFHNNVNGQLYEKNLTTGALTLESVTPGNVSGDANSFALAATPTTLIFESAGDNLVSGLSTVAWRLYVKDLNTGAITLLSSPAGGSNNFQLSADGSKIAFLGSDQQVYVLDVGTATQTEVSTALGGSVANSYVSAFAISPDGTKVAFESGASNLVAGDTNGVDDIFVKDLATGVVTRVSTTASGGQANSGSLHPAFSPDGSELVFTSYASNLVPGDANNDVDVFVKDLATGAITLVSTTYGGQQSSGELWYPIFSPDGTQVAFLGGGALVPGVQPGGLQVYVKSLPVAYDIDGAGGVNTISYAKATVGVTVNLAQQGLAQDTGGGGVQTLHNFQNLTGSAFDDHLTGDANNNVIDGGAGGNDVLDGGSGVNTVSFASAGSGVHVSLALQGQAQSTGIGTDTLSNFQALIGSSAADTLEGGGSASSSLTGRLGADTFVYRSGEGNVTVSDFSHVQGDRIDLSAFGSFHSLSDVLAVTSQQGSDAVITLGSGSLTLKGVIKGSLTGADFGLPWPTVGPGIGGAPTMGAGTITGTSGSDWLQGGSGNDALHGGAGSDYLDGGTGFNTALYDGTYRQYAVDTGLGAVSAGPEGGTDVLVNIQRIQFVDGYPATSPTDTAGQVYRLYEATLGRAPDQEGLTNWVTALNSGTSLQSVANGFVGSQEFQTDYGSLSNSDFVTLLYQNVLHRGPDAAGLNSWVNALNTGQDTRAQVVLGFSESQEDIADLSAPVQQGLWIADAAAGEVARMYDTVLGRQPDGAGLANWTHMLESGTTLQTVANGFVGSAEFQAAYGTLNNNDFVTLLYHNVLHRAPDPAGLTNWVSALSGGESRAQVVIGFSESPEHIGNMAPYVDSGVWLAG